jgi:hypothetical protein
VIVGVNLGRAWIACGGHWIQDDGAGFRVPRHAEESGRPSIVSGRSARICFMGVGGTTWKPACSRIVACAYAGDQTDKKGFCFLFCFFKCVDDLAVIGRTHSFKFTRASVFAS